MFAGELFEPTLELFTVDSRVQTKKWFQGGVEAITGWVTGFENLR
jgi:hypothetical protein